MVAGHEVVKTVKVRKLKGKPKKGMLIKHNGYIYTLANNKPPYILKYPVPEELEKPETLKRFIEGIKPVHKQ